MSQEINRVIEIYQMEANLYSDLYSDSDKKLIGKKIKGRFSPKSIEDLQPKLLPLIGEVFDFYYLRKFSKDEIFTGKWALNTYDERWPGYWVPECDLLII